MEKRVKYQVISHQHIFEPERYFLQCHASNIVRLPNDMIGVAWFAGDHEKAPNTAIWFSVREGEYWSESVKVADAEKIPHWNPVLLTVDRKVLLFYKVGHEIPEWKTMVKESLDCGKTWSDERELVAGDHGGRGPVKNKCILLQDGSILAPASTEKDGWNCFTDQSSDGGITWNRSENVPLKRSDIQGTGVIQPTLWQEDNKAVHMFMRSSEGVLFRSDSYDGGFSWLKAVKTNIPNNNCGIDLVKMKDGRLVLVYNPVSGNWAARTPIAFSISEDNGNSFSEPQILDYVQCEKNEEWAEFSYPSVISHENDIFITYTWKRSTIAFWQIRLHS